MGCTCVWAEYMYILCCVSIIGTCICSVTHNHNQTTTITLQSNRFQAGVGPNVWCETDSLAPDAYVSGLATLVDAFYRYRYSIYSSGHFAYLTYFPLALLHNPDVQG